jgi:hypothetical protein
MWHVQKLQKIHGTIFVQHLKKNMLATNCNYTKSFIILRWRKVFLVQAYIDKFQMIADQLTNIYH